MASAHIEVVATASRLGSDVRRFITQTQAVVDLCDMVKAVADQVAMGGDYAALALMLGCTEAEAHSVYNLLGSVNGELHATFITQVLARLG
jgi:hypothetical protein